MSEPEGPNYKRFVEAIEGMGPEGPEDVLSEDAPVATSEALATQAPTAIVMPAVSPQQALEAWRAYEALKQQIATPSDIQIIYERGQEKKFYKKSYWRKVATFFNLTVEVVKDTQKIHDLPSGFAVSVEYRATAPNGRCASGDGHCGTDESGKDNFMQIAGIANTRGYNRAVSNLVGGGEVSAEEMDHVQSDGPLEAHSPASSPSAPEATQAAPGFVPQSPIKFGSCKGMYPRDIDDSSLDWYTRVTKENVVDPAKLKWQSSTQHLLDELLAEAQHRKGADTPREPGADEDDDIPFEPPPAAPVYDVKDTAEFLQTAGKAKVFLGEDRYYKVLDMMQMRHSNDARTFAEMRKLVGLWREAARARG